MGDMYPYLDDPAKAVIELDAASRLKWLQGQNIWIPYPEATDILTTLDKLAEKPRHHRMPGIMIVSASNNGKTRLAMECLARHPINRNPAGEHIIMPVFRLEMPPRPDEAAIYDAILKALNQPFRRHDPISDKRDQVIRLFRKCGLKLLLIDELQRLLGSRHEVRRVVLDVLRYLSNEIPVPLATFSTERGANVLASSDEMINRLPARILPPWKLDSDFRQLLSNQEGILPLREHSKLTNKSAAALIHAMSEGFIGEVRDLLEQATETAFEKGVEKIDETILQQIRWTRPSDRKRLIGAPSRAP